MKTFLLEISEEQRQFLLTALAHVKASGYLGAASDDRDEIDILHELFDDLPRVEASEQIGRAHV